MNASVKNVELSSFLRGHCVAVLSNNRVNTLGSFDSVMNFDLRRYDNKHI